MDPFGDGNAANNDDLFDNPMFDLQASVATLQAEVTQYQKQTQQQQATIRQLQHEVSQANLQRQLLQEKVQQRQASASSSAAAWHQHPAAAAGAKTMGAAPLPPSSTTAAAEKSTTIGAGAMAVDNSGSDKPAAGGLFHPAEPTTTDNTKKAANENKPSSADRTTTTSLGLYLSRIGTVTTTSTSCVPDEFLRSMIYHNLNAHQDASLLSFLAEYSRAYIQRKLQPPTMKMMPPTSSPLPCLYAALVYCHGRLVLSGTTTTLPVPNGTQKRRPLRCRIPQTSQKQQQTLIEETWESKRHHHPLSSMTIPSTLMEQIAQALRQYAVVLLKDNNNNGSKDDADNLLYVLRLLDLSVLAKPFDETLRNALGLWVVRHVAAQMTAIPSHAPRRIIIGTDTVITVSAAASIPTLLAALSLGQRRCWDFLSVKSAWFRDFVGVTSDWVQFVLLPCFAMYRQPRASDDDDPEMSTHTPSEILTRDHDERASLACEIVTCWQSWGVDEDWLRTQLSLPKRGGEAAVSTSHEGAVRTHAPSILQLSCRLLQAIALEENAQLQDRYRALRDRLLRFLGPIVVRHAHWLDTSSRLEYASALAHCKEEGGDLAQACWDSASENPAVVL